MGLTVIPDASACGVGLVREARHQLPLSDAIIASLSFAVKYARYEIHHDECPYQSPEAILCGEICASSGNF